MKIIYCGKREGAMILIALLLFACAVWSGHAFIKSVSPVTAAPYYQGDGKEKTISLAINVDWGEEYIPDMLTVLDKYGVKATFFLTGRWADKNPLLAMEIAEAGHEIGNHAYSHASPNALSYEKNREEISRTSAAIQKACGVQTDLYAPPSGERKDHVLRAAADEGYQTILWSVDTVDWKRPDPAVIIKRVTSKAHPGAIVLAHPTNPTLEALPVILETLQKEGYTWVCVSDNLHLQ